MSNHKNISLKLFLATLLIVVGTNSINLPVSNNSIIFQLNIGDRVIAEEVDADFNFAAPDEELIVKKSGGRSSGGSFKRRSSGSGSSRSKTRNSSPRKSYSSPSRSSRRNYDRYNRYDNGYGRRRSSYRAGNSNFWNWIFNALCLLLIGTIIFLLFWLIFTRLFANSAQNRSIEGKITKERDNDKVTISKLQVALSPQATGLQKELSELSLSINTDTDAGLFKLMRESVLLLLRNSQAWTHVLADSTSLQISQAESAFDEISFAERSKFSGETLSNVDGTIRTRENHGLDDNGFPAYVVVTLILGTADDHPLFAEIRSEAKLKAVLHKLAAKRADYLMKVELLWTPQTEDEYLTDEELLMEYTNMIPLI